MPLDSSRHQWRPPLALLLGRPAETESKKCRQLSVVRVRFNTPFDPVRMSKCWFFEPIHDQTRLEEDAKQFMQRTVEIQLAVPVSSSKKLWVAGTACVASHLVDGLAWPTDPPIRRDVEVVLDILRENDVSLAGDGVGPDLDVASSAGGKEDGV